MRLPQGARKILDARLRGMRPADVVVVSFVGKVPWQLPTVYVDKKNEQRADGADYDWRFLRGLPVVIAVGPGVAARDDIAAIYGEAMLYPTLVDLRRRRMASISASGRKSPCCWC